MSLFIKLKQFFKDVHFRFILYCNILVIFAIILLYFYYQIYKNSSFKKTAFIAELIEDLEKSPIFDLGNESKKYDKGYYHLISFGKWKGTNIGCLCKEDIKGLCSKEDELIGCKNERKYNKKYTQYYDICQCPKLTKGDCSEENIRIKCQTIYPNQEEKFYQYKKTWFYGKRKYSYEYSYIKLLYSNNIIGKNQKCPDGMKPCGIIDSFDNILCLNKDDECPINDIIFDDKPNLEEYKTVKLAINNSYYHFNNKETNKKIISDLFIFKESPCYDSQEYNWINFNVLEKGDNRTGCKIINGKKNDYRYVLLDSINQFQLYQDNFFIESFMNKYIYQKDQEKMKNTMVNLYFRNFIGYNIVNLKKNNINDLKSTLEELYELVENERLFYAKNFKLFKEIYEIYNQNLIISLVISVLIILIIYSIDTKHSEIINGTIKVLIPESILFFDIFYNVINWKIKPNENKFHIINKIFDCCDEYTQYQFKKLMENVFDFTYFWNYKFYLILLAISLVLLLITLFLSFIIYFIRLSYKKIENDKETKQLVPNEEEGKELDELNNTGNNI